MNPARPQRRLLALDIGATKVAGGIGTPDGRILERRFIQTTRHDPDRLLDEVAELVEALRQLSPGRPAAIGVGTCGRVDATTGGVTSSIALGWPGPVAFRDLLAARTQCAVFVDNDVNAGAIGEQLWGAGRDIEDFVYISIGTGVGAGIVVGGRLYRGATGAAGEIGHMVIDLHGPACPCGNRGCLEVLAGGKAVGNAASAETAAGASSPALAVIAGAGRAITARDVFEAAAAGDAYARDLVRRTGEYLAVAVANLANLFDPQRVILGGGLTHTGDLLFAAVRDGLARWRAGLGDSLTALTPAALREDTGLAGAMGVALRGLRGGRRAPRPRG